MDFTLLLCVYAADTLAHFQRALESATLEQTLPPSQVIILRNGPVSADIEEYLTRLDQTSPSIHIVRLETNSGLAHALNTGIQHTTTPWIARMDADDLSLPQRFERQMAYLKSHPDTDILGTALQEFTEPEPGHIIWGEKRILPTDEKDIKAYARFQSPVHHPTVMLRTSALTHAGGYPEDSGRFEDYLLWEKMLLAGAHLANLPEVLLGYRVDSGAYSRRGGWQMLHDELALQKNFHKDGFTTTAQYIRNVLIRGLYRLIPTDIKKPLYRLRTAVKNRSVQTPGQSKRV